MTTDRIPTADERATWHHCGVCRFQGPAVINIAVREPDAVQDPEPDYRCAANRDDPTKRSACLPHLEPSVAADAPPLELGELVVPDVREPDVREPDTSAIAAKIAAMSPADRELLFALLKDN